MSLRDDLTELMLIPGLSGHEDRVRQAISAHLDGVGLDHRTDRLGNLICTIPGTAPSVMLFAHMDQLGFVVRKIFDDGSVGVERLGGIPERALLSQAVVLSTAQGDIPGIVGAPSHHTTPPSDRYRVPEVHELRVDTGLGTGDAARAVGVRIGTPVTYAPRVLPLSGSRIAGTAIDDRAGCAVMLGIARALRDGAGPTLHLVWTTQEEFNLRGVLPAAQVLVPDIAIQIDLMIATDVPEAADLGEMKLGGGPGISLYSFHGRGTLNGTIPHPALVSLMEEVAEAEGIALQRSARVGVLTDLSYAQFVGEGVAAIDVGFPMRHSHSSLECCDLFDLEALSALLVAAIRRVGPDFPLTRDRCHDLHARR